MEDKKGTALEVPVQEQLSNFSHCTGEKLNKVCPYCWVKKKPYNCNLDKCPGQKLYKNEIIQDK